VPWPWTEWSGVWFLAEERKSSLTQSNVSPYSMDMGDPTPRCGSHNMKLTTHLHLMPRFRMSGAIPLLPYTSSITCRHNFAFILSESNASGTHTL
jgi:hypothetical protein